MHRTLSFVLLLMLLAPAATATWRSAGTFEPDTPEDTDWMWTDADTSPTGGRVYFNGVQVSDQAMFNPNSGTLGSRLLLPGSSTFEAIVGIWKDCNGDGYLGLAESASREYRAELVGRVDICPVVTGNSHAHNDGEWIYEYLPIGMVEPCEYRDNDSRRLCGNAQPFIPNPVVHYLNGTFLWGDLGRPGAPTARACPTSPPQGTFSGTGAMLRWADCSQNGRLVATVNSVAPAGLAFEDADDPQNSESPLNVVFPTNLWGNPYQQQTGLLENDANDPAFTTWDCSRPKGGADARDPLAEEGKRGPLSRITIEDPTPDHSLSGTKEIEGVGRVFLLDDDEDGDNAGEFHVNLTDGEGSYAWLPAPDVRVLNPTGSYWDGAESAQDGVQYSGEGLVLARPADCDPDSNNTMHLLYTSPEGGAAATSQDKAANDFQFTFFDGARGFPPVGARTPGDLGIPYARETALVRYAGGTWMANRIFTPDPQVVDRNTLGPAGAAYVTFYARFDPSEISSRGFMVPGPGNGIYGDAHCSVIGPGAPPMNGWTCDPDEWYRSVDGEDTTPRYRAPEGEVGLPLGQVVGAAYTLRDVDCFDGTVAPGVRASLTDLSEAGSCA